MSPMNTACMLSVIIPTHNVRPWITETIQSVLMQDFDDMEVIVVDDHSEDGTLEVVERVAGADPRVKVVRAAARGGGSARNEGVDRARGEYIVFADGDDIVPEGAYRALVDSLLESGSDLAVGDYLKFSPDATWRPTARMPAFDHPVRGTTLSDIPSMIFSRPCWNKAFSRDFWIRTGIRFPDVPRSNDIVPMVTAYVKAERIDVIENVVYLYRDRPGGSSMTSRASSAASLLSYLEQEKICADLVASVGSSELTSRYSSLIHDRDGFFHVRKFLASWTEPQPEDDAVTNRLHELMEMVGAAAPWIDVRKRLTMRLFAAGNILAARAAAHTVDGGTWQSHDGLIRLRAVRALLEDLDVAAPDTISSDELRRGVAQTLQNTRILDADLEAAWVELAVAAEKRFGTGIRELIPELASGDTASAAQRQRVFGGSITPLFGGDPLRVHARASSAAAVPVLWGPGLIIPPVDAEWVSVESGMTCEADFPVSHLPRGVLLQPAFLFEDGVVVSGYADSNVPEYRPFENVLYEQSGAWVRLERRAHWAIRAPRRLAIKAIAVLRRVIR